MIGMACAGNDHDNPAVDSASSWFTLQSSILHGESPISQIQTQVRRCPRHDDPWSPGLRAKVSHGRNPPALTMVIGNRLFIVFTIGYLFARATRFHSLMLLSWRHRPRSASCYPHPGRPALPNYSGIPFSEDVDKKGVPRCRKLVLHPPLALEGLEATRLLAEAPNQDICNTSCSPASPQPFIDDVSLIYRAL